MLSTRVLELAFKSHSKIQSYITTQATKVRQIMKSLTARNVLIFVDQKLASAIYVL